MKQVKMRRSLPNDGKQRMLIMCGEATEKASADSRGIKYNFWRKGGGGDKLKKKYISEVMIAIETRNLLGLTEVERIIWDLGF